MWASFELLFTSIWNTLDDILLCLAVFLVALYVSKQLAWVIHLYFGWGMFSAQISQSLFLGCVIIFLLTHLLGTATATTLFGGLSIGVGYALQPYIIAFYTGIMIRSENTLKPGDRIRVKGQVFNVSYVGMFYVRCLDNTGFEIQFPNTMFSSTPFAVQRL